MTTNPQRDDARHGRLRPGETAPGRVRSEDVVAVYPKPRRHRDHPDRPWRVHYALVHDGGGSSWSGHYRTSRGARMSIWWNMHVASWGGSAVLVRTTAPTRRSPGSG